MAVDTMTMESKGDKMEIKPIRKVNAVDEVYYQMKALLINGTWKTGDKIPSENELCEMFQVSRITIRQAMQKLRALDLIETRSGTGSYVRKVNVTDVLNELIPVMLIGDVSNKQIFQYRKIIEPGSTHMATIMAKDKDFIMLSNILEKMQEAAEREDDEMFSRYDLDFHITIGEITGNPLVINVNYLLKDMFERSMNMVIEKMKYTHALEYHRKILTAMMDRNPDQAMHLMFEHISVNNEYFLLN